MWVRTPTSLAQLRWFAERDPSAYDAVIARLQAIWDDPTIGTPTPINGHAADPWLVTLLWQLIQSHIVVPEGMLVNHGSVPFRSGGESPWHVVTLHAPWPRFTALPIRGVPDRPTRQNAIAPALPLPNDARVRFALINVWSITRDFLILPSGV